MAKKKVKFNSKYLIGPIVLTLVMLFGLIILSNRESKTNNLQNVYEIENEQKVEESIENGVYTNHTYGFMLKYPEEKFEMTSTATSESQWIYDDSAGYIKLHAIVFEDDVYDTRKMLFDQRKKQQNMLSDILKEQSFDKYIFTYEYHLTPIDTPIDGNSSYTATWWFPAEKKGIELVFFSGNAPHFNAFLESNKPIFDQIIDSLEFID